MISLYGANKEHNTYCNVHRIVAFVFISRVDAMCKIQTLLRNQQFEEAIGLLRAARYTYLNFIKFNHLKWVWQPNIPTGHAFKIRIFEK
jgi:hypothetical protein